MFMFRHRNAGKIQNLIVSNKSFQNVAKLKYLGTTLTNHLRGKHVDLTGCGRRLQTA